MATYSGVLDDLRRLFAALPEAKAARRKAGDFSYNTGSLRCPGCDGTGQITMDIQFLPDVAVTCPDCGGLRYAREADAIRYTARDGRTVSLPQLMACTVDQARELFRGVKKVEEKLDLLSQLGLGYLTLGEGTPALSGGEAQRLKIAFEMGRPQDDALFVFDEPTIGLQPAGHPHPDRSVWSVGVFCRRGPRWVVIEHDLDMMANADYMVDMAPPAAARPAGGWWPPGAPEQVAACPQSATGLYLARHLQGQL